MTHRHLIERDAVHARHEEFGRRLRVGTGAVEVRPVATEEDRPA